jgi:hypothetical protein
MASFAHRLARQSSSESQVIIAYIEARPQRMHEDFRVLAVEAMQKAWPCKN